MWDTATKSGLDATKNFSKKVVHNRAATKEWIGNKIAKTIVKPEGQSNLNSLNIDEIFILPEKEAENTKQFMADTLTINTKNS